jgi:peptidoglycan/LPS O-acetylase OafA/YrhL
MKLTPPANAAADEPAAILRPSGSVLVPATPGAGTGISRMRVIEMARGLACVWVVLLHSLEAFPPTALFPMLRGLQHFTGVGWLGVHVFFAISGWCIAERVAGARRRWEPAWHFLRERCLRIYPTYWAALGILLGLRLVAMPFNGTGLVRNLPVGGRAWAADLLLLGPYLGGVRHPGGELDARV